MFGLDGVFGAIGNVTSTLLQGEYNSRIAGENFAYSRVLAALQNQYNIDMWNLNNEYNSPKNQLQRLVDAGLNPNLAYGTVSSGNSQRPPEQVVGQYHRDTVDMRGMFDGIGSIFSDIMGMARFQEELNGKRIENADKALSLVDKEGKMFAKFLYGEDLSQNPDAALYPVYRGVEAARDWNDKRYNVAAGLMPYYKKQIETDLGFRKQQEGLTAGRKLYQNLLNSWFKTDRIFNMVNGAAKTVLQAIPFGRLLGGSNATRYFESNRNWKPQRPINNF